MIRQEILIQKVILIQDSIENNCQKIAIYKSNLNLENFNFIELFSKKFCDEDLNLQAGRIEIFVDENFNKKILLSTNADETFYQSQKNYISLAHHLNIYSRNLLFL